MLRAVVRYLERTIRIVAHAILLLFFIRFFIVEPGVVDGVSMEPTFTDGDFFLVNKIGPLVGTIKRLDMVQFIPLRSEALVIKRVVGLPGETVMIKRNAIFIREVNGQEYELKEPYLSPDMLIAVRYGIPNVIKVPPHAYFLLGDNRVNSMDSREFGPVSRGQIIGKIVEL